MGTDGAKMKPPSLMDDSLMSEDLSRIVDEIKPELLGEKSHSQYVKQIKKAVSESIILNSNNFILLILSIKECSKPSYKRDILLEVLNLALFSDDLIINKILNGNARQWKELANSIVTLPDLVANCGVLSKFINFKAENFHSHILIKLYQVLKNPQAFSTEQQWFHTQLIGRIALSGYNQLVWDKITSKAINEESELVRKSVANILTIPLRTDKFELFIEPLYIPILFYLEPCRLSGSLIYSIIGDMMTTNESLEYIICNKSLLQTNYLHDKNRQRFILFNIFGYLTHLNDETLMKTLLSVAQCWSHGTKIMMRPYEQSRYISCAFVVAIRYALDFQKKKLAEIAEEIQFTMMKGVPNYLNRASYEYRNLAMCLCEIILPRLHELTHKPSSELKLEFEADWSEDCIEIKKMFEFELEEVNVKNKVVEGLKNNERGELEDCHNNDHEDEVDYDDDDEAAPIYLRDCINGLVENESPRFVRLCLSKACELLQKESVDSTKDVAIEMARVLLYIENQFDIDSFDSHRTKGLVLLCVSNPDLVVKYILDEFNGTGKSIRMKLDILQVLVASAQETGNKLMKYACLYFYGITHQLKVGLSETILPTTLVSAAKSLRGSRETTLRKVLGGITESTIHLRNNFNVSLPSRSPVFVSTEHQHSSPSSSVPKDSNLIDDGQSLKEHDCDSNLDDSYLLSRILFSVSLIIKCLSQQPITCKLSNDLLDILAAYRCHPDSGVRKAIISCLTVIRDCTPKVYFEEYLHDKTMCLFGTWLSNESELIKRLRSKDK